MALARARYSFISTSPIPTNLVEGNWSQASKVAHSLSTERAAFVGSQDPSKQQSKVGLQNNPQSPPQGPLQKLIGPHLLQVRGDCQSASHERWFVWALVGLGILMQGLGAVCVCACRWVDILQGLARVFCLDRSCMRCRQVQSIMFIQQVEYMVFGSQIDMTHLTIYIVFAGLL